MIRNDGIGGEPRLARYRSFQHDPNDTSSAESTEATPPGPCRPFLRAIAILDRWDPSNARRIRAVLHLSGLMTAGYPHDGRDESAESYGASDDA